jgi:hypothetical protein|tara:strand:+ start:1846 stop:2295 length:450 start_codon:yes stop_codon:yes gene_type:complete
MKIYKQDINCRSNRKTKFDATDVTKLHTAITKIVGNVRAVNTILATDHYNQTEATADCVNDVKNRLAMIELEKAVVQLANSNFLLDFAIKGSGLLSRNTHFVTELSYQSETEKVFANGDKYFPYMYNTNKDCDLEKLYLEQPNKRKIAV